MGREGRRGKERGGKRGEKRGRGMHPSTEGDRRP